MLSEGGWLFDPFKPHGYRKPNSYLHQRSQRKAPASRTIFGDTSTSRLFLMHLLVVALLLMESVLLRTASLATRHQWEMAEIRIRLSLCRVEGGNQPGHAGEA